MSPAAFKAISSQMQVLGNPSSLHTHGRSTRKSLEDAREVIGTHLCAAISTAIKLVKDAQDMDEIIKLFDKDKSIICSHLLKDKKLKRPTPDKIFREVEQDGAPVLIPASNAIGIVLQHHLTKQPTLNELEGLLKT